MHPQVQAYVDRIISNDLTLTEVNLENLDLTDSEVAPFFEALANNPGIAQQIEDINLKRNRLTVVPNLTGLTALDNLDLSYNPLDVLPNFRGLTALRYLMLYDTQLTVAPNLTELPALEQLIIMRCPLTAATKIALAAEGIMRINFALHFDHLSHDATLTPEILDTHFTAMLSANSKDAFNYFKNIDYKYLLSVRCLPIEVKVKISEYMPTPDKARARDSMANFLGIFGRLAALNNDGTQYGVLNTYNDEAFEARVKKVETWYAGVLRSMQGIIDRRDTKIPKDAVLNQPAATTPILFSTTSPTTKEPRNDTYCGFNPGFLLNRKSGLFS